MYYILSFLTKETGKNPTNVAVCPSNFLVCVYDMYHILCFLTKIINRSKTSEDIAYRAQGNLEWVVTVFCGINRSWGITKETWFQVFDANQKC